MRSFTASLAVLLSAFASGLSWPAAALGAEDTAEPVMPAYSPDAVTAAFVKDGWHCAAFDGATGLVCRGQLDGYSEEVAVVVPTRFRPKPRANLVLHIHGNAWGNTNDELFNLFQLPRLLAESRRSAIMVVPFSKGTTTIENHREMRDPAIFRRMMDALMDRLRAAALCEEARPASIILTGHSGAYRPIAAILGFGCPQDGFCYPRSIRAVHLIDATYGQEAALAPYALDPTHVFTSVFRAGTGTEDVSRAIFKAVTTARAAATPPGAPPRLIVNSNDATLAGATSDANLPRVFKAAAHATRDVFIQANVGHNPTVAKYLPMVLSLY